MQPRLVAVSGPLKGSIFPLPEGASALGRASSCYVHLADSAASREHCVFRVATGRCILRDSQSHNGTFVNGQPVSEKEILEGDQIRVGGSVFLYLTSDEAARVGPAGRGELSIDSRTIELRPQDSLYFNASDSAREMAPTARVMQDLRLLLRLSTLLHSFRALEEAQGEPAQESLARHLLALLMDIIPADGGAVVLFGGSADAPSKTLSHSKGPISIPIAIQNEMLSRAAEQRVAILAEASVTGPARLAAPVFVRDEVAAVLYLEAVKPVHRFDEGHLQLLSAVAGMAGIAWENAAILSWLNDENERLTEELRIENGMIGESAKIRDLQKQIAKVATSPATVLIRGESGTGKELIARAVHRNSPRVNGPFVAINCAALTETLLESELFGYEKGAFTGALTQRKGKLETAQGGTVFLDEIGEMPPLLQAKLLRVLQERELQRVGGTQTVKLDIRLVAATNRDLEEAVKKGTFRQDLFYRLNVVTLRAAPLRERPEDILPLAEHFAQRFGTQCGRKLTGITREARSYLLGYSWPGNVRELENTIERAVVLGSTDQILPEDLPEEIREQRPIDVPVAQFEVVVDSAKRQAVLSAFEQARYDHETAAKLLGLHPNYLHRLIRNLDMRGALKAAAAQAR